MKVSRNFGVQRSWRVDDPGDPFPDPRPYHHRHAGPQTNAQFWFCIGCIVLAIGIIVCGAVWAHFQ